MALTGQLSDMSLAELIEFFCNQRKTGRLKIDYQRGHSVFFIKEGELVDAKVGALSGAEAVYFSLTLPNAAFDFSPDVQATRRTIDQAWTQVVLEGLRRLDEGLSPTEADAFGSWSPSESELAQMLDQVEHLGHVDQQQQKQAREKKAAARAAAPDKARGEGASSKETSKDSNGDASPEPFSMMVESAGAGGGSKKKFVLAGVAAAVVLACAVAAVPLMRSPAAKPAAAAPVEAQPAAPAPAEAAPADANADASAAPAAEADPSAAADAARREERDRRERERRERERREDAAAKKEDAALNAATDPAAAAPKPAAPSGAKSVRVSISYDEAGRVTQASVAGSTPGAEAYGSTAVRIARGKRFPAGKAGSTVITIPVN
jgi:TonB family protein